MYCFKNKRILGVILGVFTFFLVSHYQSLAAYTSISLSPSTKTIYSTDTLLTVNVNTGNDEFIGMDIDIAYTGSVSYVKANEYSSGSCPNLQVTKGTGKINITCISATGGKLNDPIVKLYFKATAAGSSVFTVSSVDPFLSSVKMSGGTYTLSTESGGGDDGGDSDLPDAGIFDNSQSIMIIGAVLVFAGIFWSKINDGVIFLRRNMSDRKERAKAEKVERRRNRLEKKFS